MRGSLTLDFLLALVLVFTSTASFFALAAAQLENTVIESTQFKAEAMAMEIGSAINHFAAIQPGNNSFIKIKLNGLPESEGVASFGMPGYSVFSDSQSCNVSINSSSNIVNVQIIAYRMDSGEPTVINAYYPIVTTVNTDSLNPVLNIHCNESFKITARNDGNGVVLEVDEA